MTLAGRVTLDSYCRYVEAQGMFLLLKTDGVKIIKVLHVDLFQTISFS